MRLRIFIPILLLFLSFGKSENLGKAVKTRIHSKWSKTSILAEIGEYLANHDENLFWNFMNSIFEKEKRNEDFSKASDESIYNFGISIASRLLDSSELALLKFSLSTRTFSPRIEVHRQLSSKFKPMKCSSFFVYGSQKGCHLSELNIEKNDEEKENKEIFPFDHIFPIKSTANRTIFIYGSLESRQFENLVIGAKKLVENEKNLRLIVRFSDLSENTEYPESKVSLSGYGVELALKNTEYKAVDSSTTVTQPENLHGLNFKLLNNRHNDLQNELESLRENLEKIGEIVPLKQWQLVNLGYKTCEKIQEDQLDLEEIEDLIQDFPIHARTISHRKLNDTFHKSTKSYQSVLQSNGIENGISLLAINGRIVSKADSRIDLFSLIETMKEEKTVVDELVKIGFGNEIDSSEMLTSLDFSPIDLSTKAFDYRDAQPVFLNNLEAKRNGYTSLYLLLQPFPPDQIRPISRNIFNLIFFLDLFDSDDKLIKLVKNYLLSEVFIRIGIVPIFDEKLYGMTIEEAVETKSIASAKRGIWRTKKDLLVAIKKGNEFLSKTGLSQKPLALLNGYPLDVSSLETFDSILSTNIQKQTVRLQLSIYHRGIDDSVKIDEWWLNKETNIDIVERINQRIVTAFNKRNFVQLNGESTDSLKNLQYFSNKPAFQKTHDNVTTWIVADFENPKNRIYAVKVLKYISKVKNDHKIAIISNPIGNSESEACSSNPAEISTLDQLINYLDDLDTCIETTITSEFLSENGIEPGQTAIVSNGLIIGPFERDDGEKEEDFLNVEDFEYLENLWNEKGAGKASSFLNQNLPSDDDVTIKFFSILAKVYQKDVTRISFDDFKDQEYMVTFPPKDPKSPSVTITWIMNPVAREAQQIVSIVKLMSKVLNAKIEIIFNPPSEILEMPIKRFYRFVATEELEFDNNGSIENHLAIFTNLPQKQLLTMSIETNDGWMIEVKKADDDLDNILLETASGDVESVYSLEHILVEGQSRKTSGEASDGLEIELNSGEDKKYDTLVMLNLGYFQLKAEPGVWNLHLRNGSSSEKYKITKIDSRKVDGEIRVVVDSFTGKWTQLVVEEIAEKKEPEKSSMTKLMQKAKSYFSTPDPSETINVFSLASGHLYERFMRIMIASVMKNTKTRNVKFWLLKNYLSPKFKETIPLLADFYGFEYELVEYKWPKWLHQQTEKQRVMWGYKILFLDVLFPLNVDKIIFVDADQVVRADLQELMDFNLKGAPYGYVPFCESRKEMDGFRFWKSGYWDQHLMGRRYHISALYVVDLKTFREFSAGDRLRGRYDSLSSDPNSLSNLDQDLPNNMIHEVPIRSLPQDWLWCETWCDDKSKQTAKTIDLCNNPLTKEPKLNSAQRIIGEWKDLDEEISQVIYKNEKVDIPDHLVNQEKEEL